MTMQAADDASVAWELLRVVAVLRSKLVESNVCREQLMDGVGHIVGATGAREQHLGLMGSMASERIAQFFMRSPRVASRSMILRRASSVGDEPAAGEESADARVFRRARANFGFWFT